MLARAIEETSNNQYKCVLPQDWEGSQTSSIDIRNNAIKNIMCADLILCNFDGTDLDSGTVVEFMIAKMLDIPAVLLRTDFRSTGDLFGGDWNLMVSGYPRCVVVKHHALMLYHTLGLEKAHCTMAQSVINAFKNVAQESSLLTTYEEIFCAYQHVVNMCGAQLEKLLPAPVVHEIVASKVERNVYTIQQMKTNQKLWHLKNT